tara:strand:- start:2557 stop:3330 length:774 start_codon:yes stop_codon:yes gene_type:complete
MFFKKEEIKSFNKKEFNFLIVKICDHHLEITLNRTEKKNALNSEMINELALCTDYANHEDSIRAVIYKSNGNVFCSGLDLIDFKENSSNIQIADIFNKLHKPKLVLLEGDVHAGGVLIVACANCVISKSDVKLSLPEVKRGLYPLQVMDSLFRSMPKKSVIDWCINGKEMTAEECKKLNLIDEVCDSNLMDLCQNWIDQTLSMSPNAVRNGLRVYDELYIDNNKIDKLNKELNELKKSDDFLEGIKAFKEKRKPKWK